MEHFCNRKELIKQFYSAFLRCFSKSGEQKKNFGVKKEKYFNML